MSGRQIAYHLGTGIGEAIAVHLHDDNLFFKEVLRGRLAGPFGQKRESTKCGEWAKSNRRRLAAATGEGRVAFEIYGANADVDVGIAGLARAYRDYSLS